MRFRAFLPAAALLAAACGGGVPAAVAPAGLQPVTAAQVQGWVAATRPAERRLMRFRWSFLNKKDAAVGGRGSAQIALPDSLRFDYFGAFGAGRGAAAVVGDSALWAQPEDQVKKLVPNYPLLWAVLGIARPPQPGDQLTGLADERMVAWRYVHGADTVDYVRVLGASPRLLADVREGPKRLGVVTVEFDAAGNPKKAQLDVPTGPARLTLNFTAVSTPKPFDPEIWHAPRDDQ